MSREQRLKIINEIQKERKSILISYITGDRPGVPGGVIHGDVIRPMYSHVLPLGFGGVDKIDLFLYSRGGAVDVPWPLVTMLREYCKELCVIVPFRALSAATLIALGADSIVMGKKGELGPIDPTLQRTTNGVPNEPIPVEDVMSYVAFLKDRVGLGDQVALSNLTQILADRLSPWTLGSIYRTFSHIRNIARLLLSCHIKTIEEQRMNSIIETLAEKTYFHGHSIGRKEAVGIGLNIEYPDEKLENLIWDLFINYEDLLKLNNPFDPKSVIKPGQDQFIENVIVNVLESEKKSDFFTGDLKVTPIRQLPNQLSVPVNLQLPPQVLQGMVPEEISKFLTEMVQRTIPSLVEQEIKKISPITNYQGEMLNSSWKDATTTGT